MYVRMCACVYEHLFSFLHSLFQLLYKAFLRLHFLQLCLQATRTSSHYSLFVPCKHAFLLRIIIQVIGLLIKYPHAYLQLVYCCL